MQNIILMLDRRDRHLDMITERSSEFSLQGQPLTLALPSPSLVVIEARGHWPKTVSNTISLP